MRISDWSSDVCSSDLFLFGDVDVLQHFFVLRPRGHRADLGIGLGGVAYLGRARDFLDARQELVMDGFLQQQARTRHAGLAAETGRASCRETLCQDVYISLVPLSFKKKHNKSTH